MPLVTYLTNNRPAARAATAPSGNGSQPSPGVRRDGTRWLRIITGGTAVAALPAGSALTWMIEPRPGTVILFVIAAMTTAGAAILGAGVAMHESRQKTRRTEIEWHSTNTIAAALARYIDNAPTAVTAVRSPDVVSRDGAADPERG
jgi:hypothetical protein